MDFNISTLNKSLILSVVALSTVVGVARADYTVDDVAPYQYQAPVLTDGSLIASISFDQVGATIAVDTSGNGNDVIMPDDVVYADHDSGSAFSLGGDSNGALIANDIIGIGSVTVCFDFNANSTVLGSTIVDDSSFSIFISSSGALVSSDGSVIAQIVPGSWQHVCTSHVSGSIAQGTAVSIGNSIDGQHGWDGLIDNVQIYQGIVSY